MLQTSKDLSLLRKYILYGLVEFVVQANRLSILSFYSTIQYSTFMCQSAEYFPNRPIEMCFGKCEESLCVFLFFWLSAWISPVGDIFVFFSFLLNKIKNKITLTETFRSSDAVVDSFSTSWKSCHAIWSHFGGPIPPVPSFLRQWIMALTMVHWSLNI